MVCIYCGHKTQVTNSRPQKRLNQTWRRRECQSCQAVMTSIEGLDYTTSLRVSTATGHLQPFRRDKLFLSLHKALGHRINATDDASALTATLISQLTKVKHGALLRPEEIVRAAAAVLKRFDEAAAVQYAAYHKAGA